MVQKLLRMRRLSAYDGNHDDMILRDYLAIDRTILSNERTFLGYIRTTLTMIVVGISLVKLFNTSLTTLVGTMFFMGGFAFFIVGYSRYREMKSMVKKLRVIEQQMDKEALGKTED